MTNKTNVTKLDAVVVGAGFSGLYMLHKLREQGLNVRVYESAPDVGGTWYWNRYPGLRCDSESLYFNYTFSKEIYDEWTWTTRFPAQPEILRYLNFVADKLDLRKNIQFETRIAQATYQEKTKSWQLITAEGEQIETKYFITGIGCLSATNIPNFKGLDTFKGRWYHTGKWPHEEVDFKGKRVGIIGTGSTGVQMIPIVAKRAEHLTVFQRTPQYTIPARNKPLDPEDIQNAKENFEAIREEIKFQSNSGLPMHPLDKSALDVTPEERSQFYERLWEKGGFFLAGGSYNDLLTSAEANETAASFVREKIQQIVRDPETAKKLTPDYHIATKRIIIDTDYYETYNRDNVTLIDVKKQPIVEITENGIKTSDSEYELDIIIFATGYDAMTGPLFRMDIRGKNNESLQEKWEDGANVTTYLGLTVDGFPNMFTITGPQSPSVLGNVPIVIEQHVEWISDCIAYMEKHHKETIEATEKSALDWAEHVTTLANHTLYTKVDSWYMGTNIQDKPPAFLMYVGGLQTYTALCNEIAEKDYDGFQFTTSVEESTQLK